MTNAVKEILVQWKDAIIQWRNAMYLVTDNSKKMTAHYKTTEESTAASQECARR